jgi:hypothetical protein
LKKFIHLIGSQTRDLSVCSALSTKPQSVPRILNAVRTDGCSTSGTKINDFLSVSSRGATDQVLRLSLFGSTLCIHNVDVL